MQTNYTEVSLPLVLKLAAHEIRWQILAALAHSDYCVNELVTLLQKPMNLLSYHLRLLRTGSIVREHRSAADARDIYYSLDLTHFQQVYAVAAASLHPALAIPQPDTATRSTDDERPPVRVLFLCTHNSARSQLAEALLRHLGGPRVEVYSAGTEPSHVHPNAIALLQNHGIDTSQLSSKHLETFLGQHFAYVITVCDRAKEACPIFPGVPDRIHWSFADPAAVSDPEKQLQAFEQTFAELKKRLKLFLILLDREREQV
jgi:protein-tyrosine-phosphatase